MSQNTTHDALDDPRNADIGIYVNGEILVVDGGWMGR